MDVLGYEGFAQMMKNVEDKKSIERKVAIDLVFFR